MLAKALQGAAKGVAVDSDFENVTLLLHGNGTNGAQNNTFIDGSSNAFSITRNGNTTQGTFSPYGDNWSNYFDGTGDYLSVADNTALTLTANFTIECWIYPTAGAADRLIISKWGGAAEYYIFIQTNNVIGFAWGPYNASGLYGGALLLSGNNAFALNTWSHVAVVRNSNTFTLYVNGTSVATATNSATVTDGAEPVTIGDYNGGGFGFAGYISNARIVKGTAVYTAAFTPPTAPLTAITNTSLLTCQSNRFIDNSTNAFTITRNGDVSVQRFSPFSPTAAYASGTIGGSGYFDGTGDYLSVPDNAAFDLGSGAFTVEAWIYPTATSSYPTFFAQYNGASDSIFFSLGNSNTNLECYIYGTTNITLTGTSVITLNAWQHVAIVRNGNTFTLYRNGISVATNTTSLTVTNSTALVTIGGADGSPSYPFFGYISNLRFVKGTAVYTGAFTPPTAPLTNIANTSLLCNFTNAGIIDNAMMNDLETVGNAQISTTQSKFGGSSMYFDGTGDYLRAADNPSWDLGNTFTVEAWIYPTSTASYKTICAHDATGWYLSISAGALEAYDFTTAKTVTSAASSISTNSWQHIALVCNAGSAQFYINGTSSGSATTGFTFSNVSGTFTVGEQGTFGYTFAGYIDDLRITKGVARYTANFTAPTAPFADQ